MTTETGQRRAKAGGEFGANGEWYEGGKFIATLEHTIKSAPLVHELSDEEKAEREAKRIAHQAAVARLNAWLASRREQFSGLIAVLNSNPNPCEITPERWQWLLENGHGGFASSLGFQLYNNGSLSPKQARYALKFYFGRRNKANADEWDSLESSLVEEFQ